MDPKLWARVQEVFAEAAELQDVDRLEFLNGACADDVALREEVERLLSLEGKAPEFLAPPTLNASGLPDRKSIGPFDLRGELGRGGMAIVYRAIDRRLGREVALKVLIVGLGTTRVQIDRFRREAQAVAKLNHPGIVPVLEVGEEEGLHYFAMELVPSGDLGRELRYQRDGDEDSARLPAPGQPGHVASVAGMIAAAAEALQEAHSRRIVHRDIKPHNLLISTGGSLRLADFGLAKEEGMGSLSRSGDLLGTPSYMSPEQATAQGDRIDHRTDIYSLGVVLYEMLTLTRPYLAKTVQDMIVEITRRDPVPVRKLNSSVPRDLEIICAKAMAKEPGERFQTARDFAADLQRFLRHEPIHARPQSWARTILRFVQRHRVATASVTAALAGLCWGVLVGPSDGPTGAEVSIRTVDEKGKLVRSSASVRLLDMLSGQPSGPLEKLGELPLRGTRLPEGLYRFMLFPEGHLFREVTRRIGPEDDELRIECVLRQGADPLAGMKRVERATLSLPQIEGRYCPNMFQDVDVAAFYVDEHEVTFGQYRAYLDSMGKSEPDAWRALSIGPELDDRPVVFVSWYEARAYAEWSGKRLISHSEWEMVARGPLGRLYPDQDRYVGTVFGQPMGPSLEPRVRFEQYLAETTPVMEPPEARTANGVYHLFGNVREWTEGLGFDPEPEYVPRFEDRLILGAPWYAREAGHDLQTHRLVGPGTSYADADIGFRCARSLKP